MQSAIDDSRWLLLLLLLLLLLMLLKSLLIVLLHDVDHPLLDILGSSLGSHL